MISEKHECIFVHVPKTGGQSVESLFLKLHGLTWETRAPLLLRPKREGEPGPERLAHLYASEYPAYIDRERFDRFFKFAFVRNPFDRLASEYRYRKLRKSFRSFVDEALDPEYQDPERHIVPQSQFLTDESGALLVDFVGRFENLREDFEAVAQRLRLGSIKLPHRNSTSRLFRRASYDAATERRVRDFYAEDFERFGY